MNFSLRVSIPILLISWMLISFSIFFWLASNEMKHDESDLLKERLTIAHAAASYMDNTLQSMHALIDTAVDFGTGIPTPEQFARAERLIRLAFARYDVTVQDIGIVDNTGTVILDGPEQPEMLGGVGYRFETAGEIQQAIKEGSYVVSKMEKDPLTNTSVVLLVSPVRNADTSIAGGLIVEIGIDQLKLFFLRPEGLPQQIPSYDRRNTALGNTGYIELVDGDGFVLDRTSPAPTPGESEKSTHSELFISLINEGESRAVIMKSHESIEPLDHVDHILVFAPLSTVKWGVAIEQSSSEVFDSLRNFKIQLYIFVTVFAVLSSVMGWVVLRWLLNPIVLLTKASEKVASGDFNVSVPVQSDDETGRLSAAFNTMVHQLALGKYTLLKAYELEKQKEELRGQLLEATINACEESRKQIARELHDEYLQIIATIIMELESIEKTLPTENRLNQNITHVKSLAIQTLDSMRRLTYELRPADLDTLGLVPALRIFIKEQSENSGINIQINANGLGERLTPPIETALFRIIQEGIRNVRKHAQAKNAYVTLEKVDNSVKVVIGDDGKGFEMGMIFSERSKMKSFGLIGIHERVELLGGTLQLESQPGKGTRIKINVPLATSNGDT